MFNSPIGSVLLAAEHAPPAKQFLSTFHAMMAPYSRPCEGDEIQRVIITCPIRETATAGKLSNVVVMNQPTWSKSNTEPVRDVMHALLPRSLKSLLSLNAAAFLALLVVAGGLGGWYAHQWHRFSAEAVRINALLQGAERVRGDMYRQVEEVTRARLTEDPAALNRYAPYIERIAEQFSRLSKLAADDDERLAISYLKETYEVVHNDMSKVFTNPYEVSAAARMKLLDRAHEQWMLADFESALTIFGDIVAQRQVALQGSLDRWTQLAQILVPVPIVLAVVLVMASLRRLRRQLLLPLHEITSDVMQIKDGRLPHRLREQGVDELRALSRSFNTMANELAHSRDALVQNERQAALGALVPALAHNIRNPLASIRATAQVMDSSDEADDLEESRRSIIASADQLERWTQSLLSYLHPLEPRRHPVRLSQVVESACELLKGALEARSVRLEHDGFASDPVIPLDRNLMEQAIFGLINNAVEASPRGGAISLAIMIIKTHVLLHIDDQGPGMQFTPIPTDLTPGPTTKSHGTGLGIPFALKVIQAHGGDMQFANLESGGTRVKISIPVVNEHHNATH